ncbi:MAG: membrane protein insertion efficiency factor YidD [Eubacteriaceae bacterium]|nr:membrane protein insertion efficiency factor YidD [Eubacteriaceae bacterium]
MSRLMMLLIRGYQKYISPMMKPHCRFIPTCSEYSYQAFQKYGFFKGAYLSIRRILRCHPFGKSGYDPLI